MLKKNKSLTKTKEKQVVTICDDINGQVVINGKVLVQDKDFFLKEGVLELSDETYKKLKDKNTTSYSFYYSRKMIKRLK